METPDFSGMGLPEKEQKILEAAVKVFSEKGFSASTTSEIAKNAGIAEGTIFRYFKTKKDILRGILIQTINLISSKFVMDPIEKIFADSTAKDLRTVLKEVILDRFKLFDAIFPMARIILTEALYHEDVREALYQNIISKALALFKEFHSKMVEKGMMRDDIKSEILFRNILSSIAALIAQKKFFADKLEIADLDKELDSMIDVLMYGISKR